MTERFHRDFTRLDGLHPALFTDSVLTSPSALPAAATVVAGSHYLIGGTSLGDPGNVLLKLPDSATAVDLKTGDTIRCTFAMLSGSASEYAEVATQGTDLLLGIVSSGTALQVGGSIEDVDFEFLGSGLGVGVWLAKPADTLNHQLNTPFLRARLATAEPLPAFNATGTSGEVGETLTAAANGALTVDGVGVAEGDRVFNRLGSAQYFGVWDVVGQGDGSNPYVLRRAPDYVIARWSQLALVYITDGVTQKGEIYGRTGSPGGGSSIERIRSEVLALSDLQAPTGTHALAVGVETVVRGDSGVSQTVQFPASPADGDRVAVRWVNPQPGGTNPGETFFDFNGEVSLPAVNSRVEIDEGRAEWTYNSAFSGWILGPQSDIDLARHLARTAIKDRATGDATPQLALSYTTQLATGNVYRVRFAIQARTGAGAAHTARWLIEATIRRDAADTLTVEDKTLLVDWQSASFPAALADVTVNNPGGGADPIIECRFTGVAATSISWTDIEAEVFGDE